LLLLLLLLLLLGCGARCCCQEGDPSAAVACDLLPLQLLQLCYQQIRLRLLHLHQQGGRLELLPCRYTDIYQAHTTIQQAQGPGSLCFLHWQVTAA
jgi:hypothetical protein